MKTKKILAVITSSLIMVVTSILPVFAYENDSMPEEYIIIEKEDVQNNDGTIKFYKAATLGMGNLFNSMNFSLKYGAGTKTMSDEYTMSAEGNSKIYIKLTNLYVKDVFEEMLALSDCTRYFKKSDFS